METLILCYHNIVPDGTPPELLEALLAVPAGRFANQIRYLSGRYETCTLDTVEQDAGPQRALVLTFDDGYRAVLDHALPLLSASHGSAYVFVNPAFVGGWNPRDKLMGLVLYGAGSAIKEVEAFLGERIGRPDVRARARRFVELRGALWRTLARDGAAAITEIDRLFERHADARVRRGLESSRLLSWEDLARLREHGVRIGNHTQRHLELDSLPQAVVRSEIRDAQRALRHRLRGDGAVLSYPRGKVNPTVLAEAEAAGYRWGLTTVPGRIYDRRPALTAPRVLVSPEAGLPQLLWKTSKVRLWARNYLRRAPEPSLTPF